MRWMVKNEKSLTAWEGDFMGSYNDEKELTWEHVADFLRFEGCYDIDMNELGDEIDVEFCLRSPSGGDMHFRVDDCSVDDPFTFVDGLKYVYENFEPDYEASLWVDNTLHGINGAPYSLSDILDDMNSVQEMLHNLYAVVGERFDEFFYDYDPDEIGKEFIDILSVRFDYDPFSERFKNEVSGEVLRSMSVVNPHEIMSDVLRAPKGSFEQKRASLEEWLDDNGVLGKGSLGEWLDDNGFCGKEKTDFDCDRLAEMVRANVTAHRDEYVGRERRKCVSEFFAAVGENLEECGGDIRKAGEAAFFVLKGRDPKSYPRKSGLIRDYLKENSCVDAKSIVRFLKKNLREMGFHFKDKDKKKEHDRQVGR